MESVNEILIISDSGNKDANASMYDIQTGSLIETYSESHSCQHGLDIIGNEYLISAFDDAAKIKIWQIGEAKSAFRKMTCPGLVSAIAVSKCGHYCVVAIDTKVLIWEIATGNLEAQVDYHVQRITCIRFSGDGSHFITGGRDGLICVHFFTDILVEPDACISHPKSLYSWNDHLSEITDIYVGSISCYSRVASVSRDMTCRIYSLDIGCCMCTIQLSAPLTAVTMDVSEHFLFLGSVMGAIYKISLFDNSEAEVNFDNTEKDNVFRGHKREITSLCVSYSGTYLVSGSADAECRIWDITNFNCFRKLVFQGPVTNVICSLVPPGIKQENYVPRLMTADFKRTRDRQLETPTTLANQKLSLFHAGAPDQFFDSRVLNCSSETLEKMMAQGTLTVDDLSRINNEIYSFALNDVSVKITNSKDSNSN